MWVALEEGGDCSIGVQRDTETSHSAGDLASFTDHVQPLGGAGVQALLQLCFLHGGLWRLQEGEGQGGGSGKTVRLVVQHSSKANGAGTGTVRSAKGLLARTGRDPPTSDLQAQVCSLFQIMRSKFVGRGTTTNHHLLIVYLIL